MNRGQFMHARGKFVRRHVSKMTLDQTTQVTRKVVRSDRFRSKLNRAGFAIRSCLDFYEFTAQQNLRSERPFPPAFLSTGEFLDLLPQPRPVSFSKPQRFRLRTAPRHGHT